MTWVYDHWLVLALLAGYTALLMRHAISGKRRTHGATDYFVGGRSMGGVALGLSFFATYSSTNSFVGFSGQAYAYGAAWLLLAPAAVIFSFIAWTVIAPRLRAYTAELGSVTIPDFIGFRFGSNMARVFAALIVVFASLLYMTAVFKGAGNLLQTFLEIPYEVAILLVLVIVITYTAAGGFIAVVKTDAVQGVLMVGAALLLFSGVVRHAGGLAALERVRAAPESSHLFSWDSAMPFPVLLGLVVAGTLKLMVEPRQLSRFYALKDQRAIRHGMWISTLSFLVVYSLLLPIGLFAHAILPGDIVDTDLIMPTLLSGPAFSPVVGSFLLLAMVAAAMSSIDSVLLVLASTVARDIVGTLRPGHGDEHLLYSTRIYVAAFAILTALIALRPPGPIVLLTVFSGSLYAACFLPSVVFGLYWKRGGGVAVVASFLGGLLTLAFWRFVPGAAGIHAVFPSMAVSTLLYVTIARTEDGPGLPSPEPAIDGP